MDGITSSNRASSSQSLNIPLNSNSVTSQATRHTPEYEATVPVDAKTFSEYDISHFVKISAEEMTKLILEQNFPNDVSYHVDGDLDFKECSNLQAFPKNIHLTGDLTIIKCSNIKTLSTNLVVEKSLYIDDCPEIKKIADNLTVTGYIDINNCTNLEALSDKMSAIKSDYIMIFNCNNLKYLPEKLSVQQQLMIKNCNQFNFSANDDVSVGSIRLDKCNELTSLPKKLSVEWDIKICRCNNFNLPADAEKISIEGDLRIIDCLLFNSIPEIEIGGHISFEGCTSLTSLPNNITSLGKISNGDIRVVNLLDTGLPDGLMGQIIESETPGMLFCLPRANYRSPNYSESVYDAFFR